MVINLVEYHTSIDKGGLVMGFEQIVTPNLFVSFFLPSSGATVPSSVDKFATNLLLTTWSVIQVTDNYRQLGVSF